MKGKLFFGGLVFVLGLSLLGITACGESETDGLVQQQVAVERGDIEVVISGSGSVEATRDARLTFGSSGKVESILVKEGDRVKEGDVLAELDTSALELALVQAQVALTQAEVAQRNAEITLKNTQDSQTALELVLINAEIGLEQAEKVLSTNIASVDYQAAKAKLEKAKVWYDYVVSSGAGSEQDASGFTALERAEEQLKIAQTEYDNLLLGYDSADIALKRKQVEAAQLAVDQANKDIDDLDDSIGLQELQVSYSNQAVELARDSLSEAQRQLDEATIVAPFDGVIASIPVKEGDNIPSPSMAPTTIVYLIEPEYMELVVEIDEIDIPMLEIDQEAIITVDALPGKEYTGIVTAVNPVPNEVAGVVLYEVRIALSGIEDSGIKVGMSASSEITVARHENVLLVPSRAIGEDENGNTVVNVLSGEIIEARQVVVGLDEGLRTEIISGLDEGDTVVYEVKVKSTSMSMF